MFVPVHCRQCHKPFQIPDTSLTKVVVCPWCNEASEPTSNASPETQSTVNPARTAAKSGWSRYVLLGLLCLLAAAGTFAGSRFGSGKVPDGAWQEFSPENGRFTVLLPGVPELESVAANPYSPLIGDGERYTVRRWFDRVTVSVTMIGLDAMKAKLARPEDLIAAEVQRMGEAFGGLPVTEAVVRFDQHRGAEVQFATAEGPVVARLIVVNDRPESALYILSVAGSTVKPEGMTAQTLFRSFRLLGKK